MSMPAIQHLHVEKCGGTTLQHFFLRAFPRDTSMWMDRVCDAPIALRAVFLKAANGDQEEADRKLSASIRFSRSCLHNWVRSAMFLQELRRRDRVRPIVYIHNPYHDRCILQSDRSRPLLVVRNPLDRYLSHLKHVERYSGADLKCGRPLDRAIHSQVMKWDFEKLAYAKDSLLPLSKYSNTYLPIIKAVARRKGLASMVTTINKTIATICLPIYSVAGFLESICQHEGIDQDLAQTRSNCAQINSRFNGIGESELTPKQRDLLRASGDYRVYEVAKMSSRVIQELYGP